MVVCQTLLFFSFFFFFPTWYLKVLEHQPVSQGHLCVFQKRRFWQRLAQSWLGQFTHQHDFALVFQKKGSVLAAASRPAHQGWRQRHPAGACAHGCRGGGGRTDGRTDGPRGLLARCSSAREPWADAGVGSPALSVPGAEQRAGQPVHSELSSTALGDARLVWLWAGCHGRASKEAAGSP